MKKWIGKPYIDWCKDDEDDERKINYHVRGVWEGKEQEIDFTSEDTMDSMWLFRLQRSIIESLDMRDNEWFVSLVY